MAGSPERFGGLDDDRDVRRSGLHRTDSSSPSRRAYDRTKALEKFEKKVAEVNSQFQKINEFMKRLEIDGFLDGFQPILQEKIKNKLNEDNEYLNGIFNEINAAEKINEKPTANRLEGRISEIEVLGKSWETRLELQKKMAKSSKNPYRC